MDRIAYLSPAQQAAVAKRLPQKIEKERVTEIVRMTFDIPALADEDKLATFIMEHAPDPIQASLRYAASNNMNPESFMVMGLFPGGVLRTVGQVSEVMDCTVWMKPFDYWSVMDPDEDTQPGMGLNKNLSGELLVFAIKIF